MKYTGELSKPIAGKRIGFFESDVQIRAEAKRITDEQFAKLPALFAIHGVELGNWASLALALAGSHVPGFKVRAPSGRPTEWSSADDAEFRLDVDAAIQAGAKSVDRAITSVAAAERWNKKTQGMKTPALRQHYYRAKDSWIRMVSDARAYQALGQEN
jgi:hypothetical protein